MCATPLVLGSSFNPRTPAGATFVRQPLPRTSNCFNPRTREGCDLIRLRQCSEIRVPQELTDGICHSPATQYPNVLQFKQIAKREPFGIFRPFWVRVAGLCGVVVVKQGYHHSNNKYTNDHELYCHHSFGNSTMFSYRFWKSSASSTVSRKFCLW